MPKEYVYKAFDGISDFYVNSRVRDWIVSFTKRGTDGSEINEVAYDLREKARRYGFNPQNCPGMKPEGRGVFRIGQGMYRIIGFNATIGKRFDFVAMDWFLKRKRRHSPDNAKRYERVARIKQNGDWQHVAE